MARWRSDLQLGALLAMQRRAVLLQRLASYAQQRAREEEEQAKLREFCQLVEERILPHKDFQLAAEERTEFRVLQGDLASAKGRLLELSGDAEREGEGEQSERPDHSDSDEHITKRGYAATASRQQSGRRASTAEVSDFNSDSGYSSEEWDSVSAASVRRGSMHSHSAARPRQPPPVRQPARRSRWGEARSRPKQMVSPQVVKEHYHQATKLHWKAADHRERLARRPVSKSNSPPSEAGSERKQTVSSSASGATPAGWEGQSCGGDLQDSSGTASAVSVQQSSAAESARTEVGAAANTPHDPAGRLDTPPTGACKAMRTPELPEAATPRGHADTSTAATSQRSHWTASCAAFPEGTAATESVLVEEGGRQAGKRREAYAAVSPSQDHCCAPETLQEVLAGAAHIEPISALAGGGTYQAQADLMPETGSLIVGFLSDIASGLSTIEEVRRRLVSIEQHFGSAGGPVPWAMGNATSPQATSVPARHSSNPDTKESQGCQSNSAVLDGSSLCPHGPSNATEHPEDVPHSFPAGADQVSSAAGLSPPISQGMVASSEWEPVMAAYSPTGDLTPSQKGLGGHKKLSVPLNMGNGAWTSEEPATEPLVGVLVDVQSPGSVDSPVPEQGSPMSLASSAQYWSNWRSLSPSSSALNNNHEAPIKYLNLDAHHQQSDSLSVAAAGTQDGRMQATDKTDSGVAPEEGRLEAAAPLHRADVPCPQLVQELAGNPSVSSGVSTPICQNESDLRQTQHNSTLVKLASKGGGPIQDVHVLCRVKKQVNLRQGHKATVLAALEEELSSLAVDRVQVRPTR